MNKRKHDGYCSHDEGCSGCVSVGIEKQCGWWVTYPDEEATTQTEESEIKAGDSWLQYIKQFPKLEEFWSNIPEPTNIWLRQQIDIFAGKYPATTPTEQGRDNKINRIAEYINEETSYRYNGREMAVKILEIIENKII